MRFGVLAGAHMFVRVPILVVVCGCAYLFVVVVLFKKHEPLAVGLMALRDIAPRLVERIPGLKLGVGGKKD